MSMDEQSGTVASFGQGKGAGAEPELASFGAGALSSGIDPIQLPDLLGNEKKLGWPGLSECHPTRGWAAESRHEVGPFTAHAIPGDDA
jgi:hypothetical protein